MKYKDTKPIPRRVAIKNYLLDKRPYKAPQEQNDRVRQILANNKKKIRDVARYLMNGWQKNINANNSNGKVVVSRKNKYRTFENMTNIESGINQKIQTSRPTAPCLTIKKRDDVLTAKNKSYDNNKPQQDGDDGDVYILPKNSIKENYDQMFDSPKRIDSGRSSISKKSCSDCCRVC